ncbi:MAG: polysaccharide deacetylase [Clostridia bacterium]|nr:polysaccharide deacetylase [Clostridia bacterium]
MSKKKNNKMSNALLVCISVTLVAIIAMIAVGAYGLNNRDTVSYDDDDMSSLVSDVSSTEQTSSETTSTDVSSVSSEKETSSIVSSDTSSTTTSSDKVTSNTSLPTPDDDPFIGDGQTGERVCYLTFDDGPSGKNTDTVLKTLSDNNIKATFFVVGYLSTSKIKDVYNAGHTIGLHTYSHDLDELYADTDAFFNDLKKISDVVYQKTGVRSNLTRFPGGSSTAAMKSRLGADGFATVKETLKEQGYTYFDWNIDSGDTHKGTSKDYVINQVKKGIMSNGKYKDNVCILFHDIKKVTADALPEVIEILKDAGYTFKTLDSKCYNYAFK